jgi:ParB family chromosome partitioning protein
MELLNLPTGFIRANADNPRKQLGDLTELAASVASQGILQPLVVRRAGRGQYLLLAGHRRLAAAKLAGLRHVPVVCRDLDATVVALAENGHRRGLTPVEQARALGQLRDAGHTQAQIARLTGYSESHVSARLMLLQLAPATLIRVERGELHPDDALHAVRGTRRRHNDHHSGSRHGRPRPYLSSEHPLATTASGRCDHKPTIARDGSTIACGPCWEEAIRADERARHGVRHLRQVGA